MPGCTQMRKILSQTAPTLSQSDPKLANSVGITHNLSTSVRQKHSQMIRQMMLR